MQDRYVATEIAARALARLGAEFAAYRRTIPAMNAKARQMRQAMTEIFNSLLGRMLDEFLGVPDLNALRAVCQRDQRIALDRHALSTLPDSVVPFAVYRSLSQSGVLVDTRRASHWDRFHHRYAEATMALA